MLLSTEGFKERLDEFGNQRYSDGCDDSNYPVPKTRLLGELYTDLIENYRSVMVELDELKFRMEGLEK